MAYPIHFDVELPERQSRLTTFFRIVLIIPHLFVVTLWGIVAEIAVFLAWWAILFTGRYPQGLFKFGASFLSYLARVNCYMYLLTDRFPPFSGGSSGDGYPVQVSVDRPERSSRLTVFFRLIIIIPAYLVAYVLGLLGRLLAFFAWFVIVFTGRLPKGLSEVMELPMRYETRVIGYLMLLTDPYPWFQDETLPDPEPWTGPAA